MCPVQAGGYKISALAIENVLAAHPAVREVAVVGLPHPALGDEITAVVACHAPKQARRNACIPHPGAFIIEPVPNPSCLPHEHALPPQLAEWALGVSIALHSGPPISTRVNSVCTFMCSLCHR